jgi:hypothetical protein
MTDRELLELAGNAAGFNAFAGHAKQMIESGWNPLTDDGDALRLAVKMGIDIAKAQITFWDKDSTDPYAATRRAIVIAAAEIGKERSHEQRIGTGA